ncbi:hypothetical protein LG634_11565 [Streptomyces bambusae]|uniref:hypothetical protein n=1 Tax=Streptomyces bambusae TaxID=1550616 RepID=UPI001CFDBA52|nr:hypothetical protein [Streptomyces bambusae]MCB5165467.1 hypothetical protein [Streptomyces bambusae]
MRAIRNTSRHLIAAGAAAAVLSLSAPAAVAAGTQPITPFGFAVTPSTQVQPGGQVSLMLTSCDGPGQASSGIFDTVNFARGTTTASATVDLDARRGDSYAVTFTCNGVSGSTNLTIAAAPLPSSSPVTSSTTAAAQGVRGGFGGSVSGVSGGQIATGAALFLIAAAGTTYAMRRRPGRR